MANVVVTGASGFLGAALIPVLSERGLNVIPVSRRRLPGFVWVSDYRSSPDGDVLIHLAEDSDRRRVNAYGEGFLERSSEVIYELAHRRRQRLIYASSCAVYGDKFDAPISITEPAKGDDVYSRYKIENEKVVLSAGGCVLRLSNLTGKGMSRSNVISTILSQLETEGPVKLYDSDPVRDFLSVSDAAEAFCSVIDNWHPRVFNVGSGIGTSIGDLARMILTRFGVKNPEIQVSSTCSEKSYNVLEISETVEMLSWKPQRNLCRQINDIVES
jgi:nucleoside-diphosphate-sugar epimerase